MMFINDLLDHNRDILSFKVFNKKKNSLHVNILQNGGFVKSVKDHVFSFSFAPFLNRQDNPIQKCFFTHFET